LINRIRPVERISIVLPLKADTAQVCPRGAGGPARLVQHGHRRPAQLSKLDDRIAEYDKHIKELSPVKTRARQLMKLQASSEDSPAIVAAAVVATTTSCPAVQRLGWD
jgi:hypothetical protein